MYAQAEHQSGEQKCLPLSLTPQKARGCIQRKGFRRVIEFVRPNHIQTQNCIFEARIYSFLFQHFVKIFRKRPKRLENMGFCAVLCKTVISDKW